MNSFNSTTPNFDNLLLQTLMNKLQISTNPSSSSSSSSSSTKQSLEDLLFNTLPFSSSSSESESESESKSQLSKEESRVEKHIIKTILTGKTDSLKPNSGQAVSIGEHQICIGFHEDSEDNYYRVWEWHGHIMLFDHDNGFTPEYIYGNYFERINSNVKVVKVVKKEKEENEVVEKEEENVVGNLGLRELIESSEMENAGRILRRNLNAGSSPRV